MPEVQHQAVSFIQISDTHISADAEEDFDGVNTYDSLNHLIQMIQKQAQHYDFVIVTGDLVHEPSLKAYARLRELLLQFHCPVFCLPGNHDDPEQMQEMLNIGKISTSKQLVFDDWQLLLMNSHKHNSHGGHVSVEELQFLRKAIEQQPNKDVCIAIHHPCVSVGSSWMDSMMIDNAEEFIATLRQHEQIKLLVFGHVHQVFEAESKGIVFQSCPSTCVQFKPHVDAYQKDTLAAGYRHIALKPKGFFDGEVFRV